MLWIIEDFFNLRNFRSCASSSSLPPCWSTPPSTTRTGAPARRRRRRRRNFEKKKKKKIRSSSRQQLHRQLSVDQQVNPDFTLSFSKLTFSDIWYQRETCSIFWKKYFVRWKPQHLFSGKSNSCLVLLT